MCRVLACVLGVLVYAGSLEAQHLQWQRSRGADGGDIHAVLPGLDEGAMFAATNAGLFYSSDYGLSWTQRGMKAASIHALSTDGDFIYAGVGYSSEDGSGGIFRSSDQGQIWQRNLRNEYVTAVASAHGRICAGTRDHGVFLTTTGDEWIQGLAGEAVHAILITSSRIFVSTQTLGVVGTDDGGGTWVPVDMKDAGTIYAFCEFNGEVVAAGTKGVLISSDGGGEWRAGGLQQFTVRSLAGGTSLIAGTEDAGLFVRTSTGSWESVALNGESVTTVTRRGAFIAAGTLRHGVFVSQDSGLQFHQRNFQLSAIPIYCFAEHGTSIFAGGSQVAVSNDGGKQWRWLNLRQPVRSLLSSEQTLYAGTDSGVYRSGDGEQWTSSGLDGELINRLTSMGSTLFAGTASSGLYMSQDSARTWKHVDVTTAPITLLYCHGDKLYAGTNQGILYVSKDVASTWQELLWVPGVSMTCMRILDETLLVGTDDNDVYRSTDNGGTWNHRLLDPILQTNVRALAVVGNQVLAATYGYGLYQSSDQGLNWQARNEAFDNRFALSVLELGGLHPSRALLSTEGGGVYVGFDDHADVAVPVRDNRATLYPQPATSILTIELNDVDLSISTFEIYDSMGSRRVDQTTTAVQREESALHIDVSALSSGLYVLRLILSGTTVSKVFWVD